MKKLFSLLSIFGLSALLWVGNSNLSLAGDRDLTYKGTDELNTFSGVPASGDLELVYDASARQWKTRAATSAADTTISTAVTGNPFVRGTYNASISSDGSAILSGTSGTTVYPTGYTIMAIGGNTGGATTIDLECSGGEEIAQIPVAMLVSGVPITHATSNGSNDVLFQNTAIPCPSGEGIVLNATGTVTGATSFKILLNYFLQ